MEKQLCYLLVRLILLPWGFGAGVAGFDRYSSLGETVTLPCAGFQEYENSFIYWFFSQRSETASELVASGEKITVKQPERAARLEVLPDSSLRIHHLHTEDTGQYECQQYVNGMFYEGGTPVVLSLLTITADPGRDLKRGTALSLQCILVCNGGIAGCSSALDNVKLTWVDDEGTALQGDRFNITPYRTHSTLSLELQKSDHNRRWRCNLTEEGEVKASYSYTTTLTGEDVYSTVGGLIHFPCAKTAQLEAGQQLIWSFKRSGTTSWKTLFTFLPSGNVLTNAEEVDKNRLEMAVNTSLLIRSVQTADSGLYRCSQHKDSNLQKHLQVLVLNVLSGSADRILTLQAGSNATLTCSLTCGFVCPPAKLLWSDSNGISLQGGAREGFLIRSNITSSQLFVTGLQSSEQIRCSVEEEQRVYLQYLIQVSPPDTPVLIATASAAAIALLIVLILVIAFCAWKRKRTDSDNHVLVEYLTKESVSEIPAQVTGGAEENYSSIQFNNEGRGPEKRQAAAEESNGVIYSAIR
ncbi:hypothetical protein AOXY_G27662 [Acipenser oxyrinchus oxyrinchus]|uniref:Ig-like domain-containing protein n=1 Tax=Acipenser oxyrinchus oxyrinchus TaxID=40147 RepID=A0AAD8CR06_ACIOX|nr:hypothetical protein AOXY_G27662 [Acipenser oxyrinchus oxyrinchus]